MRLSWLSSTYTAALASPRTRDSRPCWRAVCTAKLAATALSCLSAPRLGEQVNRPASPSAPAQAKISRPSLAIVHPCASLPERVVHRVAARDAWTGEEGALQIGK